MTGDLVSIDLPEEFRHAEQWLKKIFPNVSVLYVPGNHDTYIAADWGETLGRLASYMTGERADESRERPASGFDDFPYLKGLSGTDQLAIIGMNSSPPTAPGLASGALGEAQIARARQMLAAAGKHNKFRILMLHHPINDGVESPRKALNDRKALRTIIAETGVELVLHGHAHLAHFGAVETPTGEAPVIGGGSASHPTARGAYRPGRWNLFTLSQTPNGDRRLDLEIREINPEAGEVVTAETHAFDYPAVANRKNANAVA